MLIITAGTINVIRYSSEDPDCNVASSLTDGGMFTSGGGGCGFGLDLHLLIVVILMEDTWNSGFIMVCTRLDTERSLWSLCLKTDSKRDILSYWHSSETRVLLYQVINVASP